MPFTSWRVSMFPPKMPGGMIGVPLAPAGQTPIVPMNGSSGTVMSSRKWVTSPSVRSKTRRYGSVKSSASSPRPGRIADQPQPLVWMSRTSIASVSPGSAPST